MLSRWLLVLAPLLQTARTVLLLLHPPPTTPFIPSAAEHCRLPAANQGVAPPQHLCRAHSRWASRQPIVDDEPTRAGGSDKQQAIIVMELFIAHGPSGGVVTDSGITLCHDSLGSVEPCGLFLRRWAVCPVRQPTGGRTGVEHCQPWEPGHGSLGASSQSVPGASPWTNRSLLLRTPYSVDSSPQTGLALPSNHDCPFLSSAPSGKLAGGKGY